MNKCDNINVIVEEMTLSQNKRLAFFNEVFNKARKNDRELTERMKLIDQKYQEDVREKKAELVKLNDKIKAIEVETKSALINFDMSYNLETEKEKLTNVKEKALAPKTLIYRKELHDINQKTEKLIKDNKVQLADKQLEFDENEKAYRNKMLEYEKKMKFEIQKSKQNSSNEYGDLNQKLAITDNRHEIKNIAKNIKEIRKVAFLDEKNIRIKYADLMMEEELKYLDYVEKYDCEIDSIKNEFAKTKNDFNANKKLIELTYEIENNKYLFGSRRASNNLHQKLITKKNGIVIAQTDKKHQTNDEINSVKRDLLQDKRVINEDMFKVLESRYDGHFPLVNTAYNASVLSLNSDLDSVCNFINSFLENSFDVINNLYQEYVNSTINYEYETLKIFLNCKYGFTSLNGYDYNQMLEKVNKLFEEFKEDEVKSFELFKNEILKVYEALTKNVKESIEKVKEIAKVKSENIKKYHDELEKIFRDNLSASINHSKEAYANEEKANLDFKNETDKLASDDLKMCNDETTRINQEHEQINTEINNDVNAYNEKIKQAKADIENERIAAQKEIENSSKEYIESLKNKKKEEILEINNKYAAKKEQILVDYKTQLELL